MRVLYLNDYQSCFLSDTILTGLWENGHDIYEAPLVQHPHGEIDKGYVLPDGSTNSYTGCPGYLKHAPLPPQNHTEEEIRDILASSEGFDLVVVSSLREHAIAALNKLVPFVQDREKLPIVLLDGEDHQWIDIRLIQEQIKPKIFFKREMKKEFSHDAYCQQVGVPTFPLPFGAFTRGYPDDIDDSQNNKIFDLFLSLGNTYAARSTLMEKFLEFSNNSTLTAPPRCYISTNGDAPVMSSSQYSHQIQELLPWSEYIRRQAGSRITAVMRGHGICTLHQYEAFSFATAVLYCPGELHTPHEFLNLKHCIYINEACSNVSKVLETLLNEDQLRIQIAESGKQHCLQFHTTAARAKYLIECAQSIFNGEKIDDIYENHEIR